jgi:hypothetical protein
MPRRHVVLIASLLVSGLVLGGCSPTFDPTEWFNTKKPLPGDRKAVFPQGVPGVPEGVPPELVEGYKPSAEPVPEPLPVQERPKPKPKPKPTVAAAPPRPAQAQRPPQGSQGAWPDAPSQGPPPAQPQSQSQSVFPEPPRQAR